MTNILGADIKTTVKVSPEKSQVLLVALTIVLAITLIGSMLLLFLGQPEWWWFLIFSAVLLVCILLAWVQSQPDSDLHNAHPTSINFPDGTSLSTDTRGLRSPEILKGITRVINEAIDRNPLPIPEATLDSNYNPIPNSQESARAIVDSINTKTQQASNAILDCLGMTEEQATNLQEVTSTLPSGHPKCASD